MQVLGNNTFCPVCGKAYKVCRNCAEAKINSWKTVTDTVDCFKVFTVLHAVYVTETMTKEEAKKKLAIYDFSDMEGYPEYVKEQITEIIGIKDVKKKAVKSAE